MKPLHHLEDFRGGRARLQEISWLDMLVNFFIQLAFKNYAGFCHNPVSVKGNTTVLVLITLFLVYLMNILCIKMCVCACNCLRISKTYEFVLETALHFREQSKNEFQTPVYNHAPLLNQNNPRLIIVSTSISDRVCYFFLGRWIFNWWKKKCNTMRISIEHP